MNRFRLPVFVAMMAALSAPAILFHGGPARAEDRTAASPASQASASSVFIHVATPANSDGNFTDIDNPATNGKPDAILLVTANWAPYQVYNDLPIGVWYHKSEGKWSIFNEDNFSPIPDQAAFNVQVLKASKSTFIHLASSENTAGSRTEIDNSSTNRKPLKILEVTQNWAPRKKYNNHPIGVSYDSSEWGILNEDLAAMPRRAAFNVHVLKASASAFVHIATPANSFGNWTDIDNPVSNGNPNAIVLVTPNYTPGSVYDNHTIGVWYDVDKWSIFNQDGAPIPDGAAFNVNILAGTL